MEEKTVREHYQKLSHLQKMDAIRLTDEKTLERKCSSTYEALTIGFNWRKDKHKDSFVRWWNIREKFKHETKKENGKND